MSNYQINAIVTRALADPDFQKAILNGQRRERLQDFKLPPNWRKPSCPSSGAASTR